jgi:superfamily II DNA or RNA helicase
VATYQTLNNEQRLAKFNPRTLKAIIVDEAHHAAAPSQVSTPHFFNGAELTFYVVIAACCLGLILKFSTLITFLSQDQNPYTKFLS